MLPLNWLAVTAPLKFAVVPMIGPENVAWVKETAFGYWTMPGLDSIGAWVDLAVLDWTMLSWLVRLAMDCCKDEICN